MCFPHVYCIEEQMMKKLTEERHSFWTSTVPLIIRRNIIIIISILCRINSFDAK